MNFQSIFTRKKLFNTIIVVSAVVVTLVMLVPFGVLAQSGPPYWEHTGSDVYYNAGNVGIGTTAPTEKLEVAGRIKVVNGNQFWNSYQDGGGGYLEQRGYDGQAEDFRIQSAKNGNPADYSFFLIDPTDGFAFLNSGSANGNVGIGTETPTEKLEVDGNIKLTSGDDTKLKFRNGHGNEAVIQYDYDGNELDIRVGGTSKDYTKFFITDDGTVCIGDCAGLSGSGQ